MSLYPDTADFDILNARLVGHLGLKRLCIRDRQITQIQSAELSSSAPTQPSTPESAPALYQNSPTVLDVQGDWVSLGGIDLQINGALGLAFPDLVPGDEVRLTKICDFLWHQGIDGFLPTLVTTTVEKIHQTLAVLSAFVQQGQPPNTAKILGVHLEGPCLNPEKRGAHPAEYLLPLTIANMEQILGDYADWVKVVTLAPELDPSGETVAYLRSLGITVSLGHSQATAQQANQAFRQGATMVTHAFNAMPGLHHRRPGLLGAALVHPQVYCGLIADGEHVCPTMLDLLLRVNRSDHWQQIEQHKEADLGHGTAGIFLVSDALSPLGLPDGTYPWDDRQIQVQNGTARLDDGTLAGTTRSLLVGVHNLVQWGLCSVEEAIALAALAPRRALGLPTTYTNQPAALLRWRIENPKSLTWERI